MATRSELIATAGDAVPEAVRPGAEGGTKTGWRRWVTPSLFDLIVVALPIWFFGLADGGTGLLLSDGDTGWHTRTGDWILQNRSFVHGDMFSFTKPGEPWFAWEWLTDVLFSSLHATAGVKGILMFGIVMGALFCGLLLRHMVWRGANVFIAMPLALMGFGAATVHLLARPHLWTMVAVAAAMWLIQRDLRTPTRWIWILLPAAAVWANLHGGWLALVSILGLVAVGTALEALLGEASWLVARRYVVLSAGCFAASIVNPYGWQLHVHMLEYLSADWIKEMVSEFKSPSFRSENMAQFELLLLASVVAAGLSLRRKRLVAPLLILFWAHSSLTSARHIPLFVAVSLPFLADEIQRVWTLWTSGAKRNSTPAILQSLASDAQAGIGRMSVWAVIPFVVVASPLLSLPWPKDFPPLRFPVEMVARHPELLSASRVYTEDQWADYLIYKLSPRVRVFFDGRSDFYGEKVSREYCDLMNANYRWRELLAKYRFDAVMIRPGWALAAVLKESREWRVIDDDKKAILFVRSGVGLEKAASGANEKP
jgi:hypothetical protein